MHELHEGKHYREMVWTISIPQPSPSSDEYSNANKTTDPSTWTVAYGGNCNTVGVTKLDDNCQQDNMKAVYSHSSTISSLISMLMFLAESGCEGYSMGREICSFLCALWYGYSRIRTRDPSENRSVIFFNLRFSLILNSVQLFPSALPIPPFHIMTPYWHSSVSDW